MERSRSQGLGISIATAIHFCTGLSTTRNIIASSKISISDHCGWRRRRRRTTLQDYGGQTWYVVFPAFVTWSEYLLTAEELKQIFSPLSTKTLRSFWHFWLPGGGLTASSHTNLTSDHWIPLQLAHRRTLRILEVKIDEPALKLSTDMYGHPRLSENWDGKCDFPSPDSTWFGGGSRGIWI